MTGCGAESSRSVEGPALLRALAQRLKSRYSVGTSTSGGDSQRWLRQPLDRAIEDVTIGSIRSEGSDSALLVRCNQESQHGTANRHGSQRRQPALF